ncbi:HAD-IIA family hydrolase [Haloechinothrix sp. LS1_15]|uniref:HAD-IIA family hydrolase n=1 Tax=Haloechinothrix sp. LS1_15 TaxID=2652248 RepID=UPI00294763C9|nr:HAD-IIA family hydrolase [Haloechinothrix sp. LS1_15]MDV6013440.1 HAD-IIA family hydrolase [Haloechinothrix sp. LS1_15]
MTLLCGHDAVLLDLDGTIHHGNHPVPGVGEVLTTVREQGVAVRFVTNNAATGPAGVAERLTALGVPADSHEVTTSAQAAAMLLAERLPAVSTVLVVGSDDLRAEVAACGMRLAQRPGTAGAGAGTTGTVESGQQAEVTKTVDAVVQGHSPDTAWRDLAEACLAIRAGALWVACNTDPTLPTERGQLPGNGAMVAALRTATGCDPHVAGKPAPLLFRRSAADAAARYPLVVGDRMDTDIAGAHAAGLPGLLVLSGVTTAADVLRAPPENRPTYLASDITALQRPPEELTVGPRAEWDVEVGSDALLVTGRDRAACGTGSADPLDLLRALCRPAWQSGLRTIVPREPRATEVAAQLGLL